MHAQTNSEVRNIACAREAGRSDLALHTALSKSARHQNAVHPFQMGRRVFLLEDLRLNPLQIDLHLVGDAAMGQGLIEGFVGIEKSGVLANDRNGHFAVRFVDVL